MIYFNQFYFLFKKRTAAAPPPPRRRPPAPPPPPPPPPSSPPPPPPSVTDRRSTRARARARGHLSTAEYKWLSELFQSMILMAGDQESLPPALRHVMAGRGRFMRASEVPKSTQKLVQPVVVAGLRRVSVDTPPDPYDRPIRSMMTISRAARPRTSWVRSATRSQLRGSRPWPTRGRHAGGSRQACGQKKAGQSGKGCNDTRVEM